MTASKTFNAIFLIDKFTLVADGANHFSVISGIFFLFFGSGGLTGNGRSNFLALFAVNDAEFAEVFLDHITDFGCHRGDIFAFFEVSAVGIVNTFELIDEESRTGIIAEYGRNKAAHRHDPAEMLEVFGIDEKLIGAELSVFLEIVDGNIESIR